MKKLFLLAAAVVFAAMGSMAQTPQPLPVDPNVRIGVLDNGLTYYIRHNEQPKERCEFHIAQGVGAILEEDHQDGLAHFLEHMAFNGTEHFPGKLIINYFESVGVNFGGNINAYTSLDETVYRLSNVPTYREGILDSALMVMHDWSCAISLLGEEIDNERGVIREEWRTGNNASRRLYFNGMKLKYPGSKYAIRDVIGDTAVINNFSYQALRDYYHLWYGPDLQSIVVVGDIDVDKMEQKLVKLFNTVPERKNRGVRPRFGVDDNKEPVVARYTDKEAQYTMLEFECKHPALPREVRLSDQGYLMDLFHSLIKTMINYRIQEEVTNPEANIIQALGAYDNLVGSTDAFQMIFIPKDGREKAAFADMITMAEKIKRYGFTAAEFERAKTEMLSSYERSYNERNTRENISFAREYYRNYLDGEPIPGIEWEYQFVQGLLPQLPVAMVNELAKAYITDENIILAYLGKDVPTAPSKDEMLAIYEQVRASEIEAPVEEVFDRPLVENAPKKAGKIKKEKFNAALGTTEWTLSNGINVIIKPTAFKNDEIVMNILSKGGWTKVATEDLPSAVLAGNIVDYNGLADFSTIDLQKILTGKKVSVSPLIDQYSEYMKGSSSVKDFETMLQLSYLYFTAPRKDDKAFSSMMQILETSLAAREQDPSVAFNDSIEMTVSDHHERTVIVNTELLKRVNQDRAIAIYKERFANPADFTVIFVGNIDPKDPAVRKQICTWLGSLKTKKTRENFTDHGIRYPKGIVNNYFEREMQTNTASNRIMYTGDMEYNLANRLNMNVIGKILSTRYLESIREREGGSYGVGVAGWVENKPVDKAVLLMQFDTDPEKQQKLMGIIHQEIRDIVNNGPLAEDLQKVKESMLKDHAEDMEDNSFWMNAINRYYNDNIDYVNGYVEAVNAITAETVTATLKALVEQGNVIEVVMSPEK